MSGAGCEVRGGVRSEGQAAARGASCEVRGEVQSEALRQQCWPQRESQGVMARAPADSSGEGQRE